MKKIISLFKRDYEGTHLVYDEVVEGAEWVQAGEGIATRKMDGTGCLLRGGKLFKRYTLKRGKTAPRGFEPVTEINPKTGKQEGWVPVGQGDEDKWFREGLNHSKFLPDGTYELCGPKVQGNPEGFPEHVLYGHNMTDKYDNCPRTFDALKEWFKDKAIEGVVWHHADGRMVKIKKKDFGLKR